MNLFLIRILQWLMRLLFGVSVPETIPHQPCLLVANHNSHLDVVLISFLLNREHLKNTYSVVAADFFNKGLIGWIARLVFNPILIDRKKNATQSPLEPVIQKLKEGKSIIIFPEGTRGAPGEISMFKRGVGLLAQQFPELPVWPIYLTGAERAWAKGDLIPVPMNCAISVSSQPFYGRNFTTPEEIAAQLEQSIRNMAGN